MQTNILIGPRAILQQRRENTLSLGDFFHQIRLNVAATEPILYFPIKSSVAVLLFLFIATGSPPPLLLVSSSLALNTRGDILIGPIQVQFPA